MISKQHYVRQRVGWIFVICVIFIGLMGILKNYQNYNILENQMIKTIKQEQNAKNNNKQLKQYKTNLKSKKYILNYIRKRYMYTKNNEIVYYLPNGNNNKF